MGPLFWWRSIFVKNHPPWGSGSVWRSRPKTKNRFGLPPGLRADFAFCAMGLKYSISVPEPITAHANQAFCGMTRRSGSNGPSATPYYRKKTEACANIVDVAGAHGSGSFLTAYFNLETALTPIACYTKKTVPGSPEQPDQIYPSPVASYGPNPLSYRV